MRRLAQVPRVGWRRRCEEVGFGFHSIDDQGRDVAGQTSLFAYWREDVAYRFTAEQIDRLDDATAELHAMCMELVRDLVDRGDLQRLRLIDGAQALIEGSWRRADPSLYGRFDLSFDGEQIKLLEYNADTPTSIVESAVAQWAWLEDVHPAADQFNSLHEKLLERLKAIAQDARIATLHLSCHTDSLEDVGNVEYLMDLAVQAGMQAHLVDVQEIGISAADECVDENDQVIQALFKLVPWEWLVASPYGDRIDRSRMQWLEPPWKMALSTKALLVELWRRHPGHPLLLAASFEPLPAQAQVAKPIYSREGANVTLYEADGTVRLRTPGIYGSEGMVHQALAPLPAFRAPETTGLLGPREAIYPVIGAWVVGDASAGICVREDISPVTRDSSYFVPHYFID